MPPSLLLPETPHQQDLVRTLIRYIQSDRLSVGERLPPIRALAERFGVTGSAVRDALIQLQTMGMIKVLPRSGAFVQSVNFASLVSALTDTMDNALMQADASLFHLLDARQLIEVECATTAARRRRLEDLLPIREALAATLDRAGLDVVDLYPGWDGADVESGDQFVVVVAERR